MALTIDQLNEKVDLLAQRIAMLATVEQITNLQDLVSGWKNDHYDHIVALQSKDGAMEVRLNDLEARVQALESA